jgi:hypothetical protein
MDASALNLISNVCLVTIPAAFVGAGLLMALRTFVTRDQELRLIELRYAANKETKLLKLQAYERMAIFLERIAPGAVLSRVLEQDMINHELQLAVIRSIRSEFEHNLSQQIYISSDAWNLIVSSKDELIKAVGMIAAQVPSDATGQQVGRVILEAISKSGQALPTQTALEFLKNEAREIM